MLGSDDVPDWLPEERAAEWLAAAVEPPATAAPTAVSPPAAPALRKAKRPRVSAADEKLAARLRFPRGLLQVINQAN